jgi:hypothetical protein
LRSDSRLTPRSRATPLRVLPSRRVRRTASALNSGGYAGRGFGIGDSHLALVAPTLRVSTEPGQLQSPTGTHLYTESNGCGGTAYTPVDLGTPPTPNYPVYVSWDGVYNLNACSGAGAWYFDYRRGSWLNAPIGTAVLPASTGYPEAALEEMYYDPHPPEHINTTWFGLDNNQNVNNSYGLHLSTYATGNWALWSNSGTT